MFNNTQPQFNFQEVGNYNNPTFINSFNSTMQKPTQKKKIGFQGKKQKKDIREIEQLILKKQENDKL